MELIERIKDGVGYSHNFATAKPNILRTEKEHILGLCALLTEAAAALEAAREDACVALVADIRFACGDNGKRMQPELVEFIRELAEDAERMDFIEANGVHLVFADKDGLLGLIAPSRENIDAARKGGAL
jgi:hypothetical protein